MKRLESESSSKRNELIGALAALDYAKSLSVIRRVRRPEELDLQGIVDDLGRRLVEGAINGLGSYLRGAGHRKRRCWSMRRR